MIVSWWIRFREWKEIIKHNTPFKRSKAAVFAAIGILRRAVDSKQVFIDEREASWLDIMEGQLENVPDDEEAFIKERVEGNESEKFDPKKYDLSN